MPMRLDSRRTVAAGARTGDAEAGHRGKDRTPVSRSELEILARVVKGECPPDTPFEGKVAVAAVVLNRVRSDRFPMSIAAVAHQHKQFSCYNRNNRARLYDGSIPRLAREAVRAAIDGRDPTEGSTFFFNPHLVRPSWARRLVFAKRIGTAPHNTHEFYRHQAPEARAIRWHRDD